MVAVVACAFALLGASPASAATENIPPTATVSVVRPGAVAVDAKGETYVVSSISNTVDVFDLAGNPIRTVVGAQTQLNQPIGMTVDANRYLYVANSAGNTIVVFAPDSDGDATPVRVISGTNTQLNGIRGLAVDAAGNIFATNYWDNSITVYAPGASGDVAPIRTISGASTGLNGPYDIDLMNGVLYVASLIGNSITEYGASANGDQAPLRTIVGAATGLDSPMGIGVDEFGNVYAGNYNSSSVTVYTPLADGNTVPARVLAGSNTGISGPGGLTVDDAGTIFVSNATPWTMTFYATAPTITGITVTTGSTAGGTQLEVTGTGFSGGVTAAVGGAPADVDVINSTRLQITTGAHAAGPADVVITTRGGVASLPGAFTFVTPAATDPAQLAPTGGSFGGTAGLGLVVFLLGILMLAGHRTLRRRSMSLES
jgi:sugar lactone lactonase YvrE